MIDAEMNSGDECQEKADPVGSGYEASNFEIYFPGFLSYHGFGRHGLWSGTGPHISNQVIY